MGFVREEELDGGGTYRLWPEGGWPRYVRVGDVEMWDAFTFTAESWVRPGIQMQLKVRVIDGAPQCVGVRFITSHDDEPINQAVLRELDLEVWMERACVRAVETPDSAWESMHRDDDGSPLGISSEHPAVKETREAARTATRRARRQARTGYSDQLLRQVAELYERNVGSFPTKAVRDTFGVAQSTAQLYVKKARERGFITAEAPKGGRP